MNPLLLAIVVAVLAVSLLLIFFQVRTDTGIGVVTPMTLRCGESEELEGRSTPTTYLIAVDSACNENVELTLEPGQQRIKIGRIEAGEVREDDPKKGAVYCVEVPPSKRLVVACPGEGDGSCDVRAVRGRVGSDEFLLVPSPPQGCSNWTEVVFNLRPAGPRLPFKVVFESVCENAAGTAVAPQVRYKRVLPPNVGDARLPTGADRVKLGNDGKYFYQGGANPGEALEVSCGTGTSGDCRFTVKIL